MRGASGTTFWMRPAILLLNLFVTGAYNGSLVTHGCFLHSQKGRYLLCVVEISKTILSSDFSLNGTATVPSKCDVIMPPQEKFIETRIRKNVMYATRVLRCPLLNGKFLEVAELCWMSRTKRECQKTDVELPLSPANTSICGYMLESPRGALPYFIAHHLQVGFDRIQIYVNQRPLQDGTIESDIYNQKVRFVPWTNALSRSEIFYGGQTAAIYHCQLSHFKQRGLLCIFDVDDFLVFPKRVGYNLKSLEEEMQRGGYPQILFQWKLRYPECQPLGGCSNLDIKACFPCAQSKAAKNTKHCSVQSRINWEAIHRSWHSQRMKKLFANPERAFVQHVRRGVVRRGGCCNGTEFRDTLFK